MAQEHPATAAKTSPLQKRDELIRKCVSHFISPDLVPCHGKTEWDGSRFACVGGASGEGCVERTVHHGRSQEIAYLAAATRRGALVGLCIVGTVKAPGTQQVIWGRRGLPGGGEETQCGMGPFLPRSCSESTGWHNRLVLQKDHEKTQLSDTRMGVTRRVRTERMPVRQESRASGVLQEAKSA